MGTKRAPERASQERKAPGLAAIVSVLMLIGLASSAYLTNLYIEVSALYRLGPESAGKLESFCNINEGVNCVTVAASEYSSFLGVPIAVYGVQFFGLTLALILGSYFRLLPLRRWQSLAFVASALALPGCAVLGWISVTKINSVCIMCLTVYAVTALTFLVLGAANRRRLKELAMEGPQELIARVSEPRHRVAGFIAAVLLLSQFVWVPRVMGREGQSGDLLGTSAAGIASSYKPGAWLDQPASGLTLGPANAPIRIEEFTDFQCPFCGRAHKVMLEVVKRFPGKIHLVHRDFPLDHNCNPAIPERFHENACNAAFHARCAADQDYYWPFETMLFEHQRQLDDRTLLSIASKLGLNANKMKACAQSPGTRESIVRDIQEGIARGVQGTPTCFVNGEALVGAHPMEFWEQKIQSLLDQAKRPAASGSASAAAAPTVSAPPAPPTSGSAEPAAQP